MPLSILPTRVVGGMAAVAGPLRLTGHSRPFPLDSPRVARQEWQRQFPDDTPRQVLLAHQSALILTDQGPGLLRVFVADTIARPVVQVTPDPKGLRFAFRGFAASPALIRRSSAQSALWQQAMETAHHV